MHGLPDIFEGGIPCVRPPAPRQLERPFLPYLIRQDLRQFKEFGSGWPKCMATYPHFRN